MKSILVPTEQNALLPSILQSAFLLARKFDSYMEGFALFPAMVELYALDSKLDVKPAADAFETRANVIKAIQGHILGKAVYGGLFKRPQ